MKNIKRMLEEYDKTCERLRKGEYDNLEDESARVQETSFPLVANATANNQLRYRLLKFFI